MGEGRARVAAQKLTNGPKGRCSWLGFLREPLGRAGKGGKSGGTAVGYNEPRGRGAARGAAGGVTAEGSDGDTTAAGDAKKRKVGDQGGAALSNRAKDNAVFIEKTY